MEAVNLLPAYARPGHPWASVGKNLAPRQVFKAAGIAAGVVVLLLGAAYVLERSAVNHKRNTLAQAQAKAAAADAKAAPLRAAQSAVAVRMVAGATVTKDRIVWERLLSDISRVLPSQVYLQTLAMQSPTPLAGPSASAPPTAFTPGGTAGFTLTGVASSHVRVALVLDRLSTLPWISNLMLLSSTNGTAGSTPGSTPGTQAGTLANGDTFTVSATFDPTGGAK